MTQYENNTNAYLPTQLEASPALDTLCQDLDSFIGELTDDKKKTPNTTHHTTTTTATTTTYATTTLTPPSPVARPNDSPPASPSLFPSVPALQRDDLHSTLNRVSLDDTTTVYTSRGSSLDKHSLRGSSLDKQTSIRTSSRSHNSFNMKHTIHEEGPPPPKEPSLTNNSLLSELSYTFVDRVRETNKRRRIFCTEEYPMSFTGEEAIKILRDILPDGLRAVLLRKLARALMHTSPPLISPISYSEKSVRKNTLYDSPHEVYTIEEFTLQQGIAQGVYTALSPCYTLYCTPELGGCYAPCCPNRVAWRSDKQKLHRHASIASSSVASSHETMLSRAWQASVPREILQSTPEQEVKRQEAIHELIYTEEDYARDLNLLDDLFAKSLRSAQCIDAERRDAFCDLVFNNYLDILYIHRDLNRELRDYQSLCQERTAGGFVDQIGDIFLKHLPRFKAAYTQYGPHVVLAEYAVKSEYATNMLFQNFIREKEKQAECRKLPFRHFLVLPVTRLQRYPLLIDAVLKRTQDDHPDKDDLGRCVEVLRDIGNQMNLLADSKRMTLRIYEIDDKIKYKTGEHHDLRLREKGRQLVHEGVLYRRSHMGVESTEIHVFLFDHLLLMTKLRGGYYFISRRPIPLELLHVHDATEGFSLGVRTMTSTYNSTFESSATRQQQQQQLLHCPTMHTTSNSQGTMLVLRHLGRSGADHLLYADDSQQRQQWKQMIVNAKATMDEALADNKVFEIRSLSDTTFSLASAYGKITCSTAFVGARGIRMVAIGTETGVWMGMEGDTNNLRKVLHIGDVTQVGVLEEHHVFLVLADKTLVAYPLDYLDPTVPNTPDDRPSYKVAHHVSFFETGICNGRTLVFVKKKKGIDSLFRGYEPICGDLRDPRNAKYLTLKTGFLSKAPVWFKLYREFYIGAEASSLQFLKARLAIVCVRGFEIIDLNKLTQNHNLPDLNDPAFSFIQERYEEIRPLGMFRCRDHYLLCYDAFAFRVNINGRYANDAYARIDWEGTPHSVAFSYPYVIAFDEQFIEVRNAETGQLVQILAGENMRMLQYRQNSITPPVIHGCMNHPFKPNFQYVFHLVGVFEPSLVWQ